MKQEEFKDFTGTLQTFKSSGIIPHTKLSGYILTQQDIRRKNTSNRNYCYLSQLRTGKNITALLGHLS
ncbi:MAG: hypothetical protein ABI416_11455 [Ginsengibacter sp.]